MKKSLFMKYIILLVTGLLLSHFSIAQESIINGRVFDTNGMSVEGASVTLADRPERKVTTDKNGNFAIAANVGDKIIVKIAYVSKTFTLKKSGTSYKLKKYQGDIHFGFQFERKQEYLTSAVSTVFAKDLERFTVINPANALYGQITGLTVLQKNGPPWSRQSSMRIRGIGTFNSYGYTTFVDGFERNISSYKLEEIESISILKDAASLAMFGQQGANGILLINTKRGEYNTFNVDVKYEDGFNTPFKMPNFLDAYNYALAVNEASVLDGNSPVYSEWDLEDYKNGSKPYFYPNVNWKDEVLKNMGRNTNFVAQFNGGGNRVRYYSMIGYQTEKGLLNYTDVDPRYDSQLKYRRLNLRVNIDAKITNTTTMKANVGANLGERKYPGTDIGNIMSAVYNIPSASLPVKSLHGYWGGTDYYGNNPAAQIGGTGYRQDFFRDIMADLSVKQDLSHLIKGVSVELAASVDNTATFLEGNTKTFEYEVVDVVRDQNTGIITDTISQLYGIESDLTYYNGGVEQWRQAALIVKANYELSWENSQLISTFMYNQSKEVAKGQYNTWLAQNYFLFSRYNYKKKYFADLVLGASGSSMLIDNKWFGFFPAISGAWIVSEEDFLKDNSTINFLKFRASAGIVGNDKMEHNLMDQKFVGGGSYFYTDNFNSLGGYRPDRIGTEDLTYEKSYKYNFGFDLYMFNKLSVIIDAYYNHRTDILVNTDAVISDVLGVVPAKENMGIVNNRGIELELMWNDYIGKLSYYVGGSFTYNKNKIIEQNEEYRPYDYLKRTGLPIGQNFGYEVLGFFRDSTDIANSPVQMFSPVRPGDVKYKDQNNDGKIDKYH
jgi:TonB-linked SusC/RagA family outer membrane protein